MNAAPRAHLSAKHVVELDEQRMAQMPQRSNTNWKPPDGLGYSSLRRSGSRPKGF